MAGIAEGGFTWNWGPCKDSEPHKAHPHGLGTPGGPRWCVGLLPDGSRPSRAFSSAARSTAQEDGPPFASRVAAAVWAEHAAFSMAEALGTPVDATYIALVNAMRASGIVR